MRSIPTVLFLSIVFGALCAMKLPATDIFVHVPTLEGEPGEEAAIEFRVDSLDQPIGFFLFQFDLDRSAAEFIRTEIEDTASAHAPPQGIIFDPHCGDLVIDRCCAGVNFSHQGSPTVLSPGEDLLILKAILRILPEAREGSYPIKFHEISFYTPEWSDRPAAVDGVTLAVKAPTRPRPVGSMTCSQEKDEVLLNWSLTEQYDGLILRRNGKTLATLDGSEVTHRDGPPVGPATYQVVACRGGLDSFPASCDLLVEPVRPESIRDFTCEPSGDGISLSWTNGEPYDSIALFRNGRLLEDLPGSAHSFQDPFRSDLFTLYTVKGRAGGMETLSSLCKLNEFSDYVLRADDLHAMSGERRVPIRIYGTNPGPTLGFSINMALDPSVARSREIDLKGTATEEIGFGFAECSLHENDITVGIVFNLSPPMEIRMEPGADHHLLTILADISESAPSGIRSPIEFVDVPQIIPWPARLNRYVTGGGEAIKPRTLQGSILVGRSPVPAVVGAMAEAVQEGEPPPGGGANTTPGSISVSWRNAAAYDSIAIERDGEDLAEIPGDRTSYLDSRPGPGIHRYRITGKIGGTESFPAQAAALPRGVPGTFLRGDANSDRRINIADPISILNHLFWYGAAFRCPDAADTDDDGLLNLSDVVGLIHYLFRGAEAPPPPGVKEPWFDPSADDLDCGS